MSDEELIEAVEEKYSDYAPEALEIAKQELIRRNIAFIDEGESFPTNDADPFMAEDDPNADEVYRGLSGRKTTD
jgi:hypothetical protein